MGGLSSPEGLCALSSIDTIHSFNKYYVPATDPGMTNVMHNTKKQPCAHEKYFVEIQTMAK